MTVAFLGIDLAWQSQRNPTGGAALSLNSGTLELTALAPPLRGLEAVQEFIQAHATERTVIAVDGPLVIPNVSGQRICELEVSRRYGARHASCHASNLTLYPDPASVRLSTWLREHGFEHATSPAGERTMLEVYPHAAFVALLDRPHIIRYKKGRVSEKCMGLREVQSILSQLPIAKRHEWIELLERDPASMRGAARKEFEDLLDAAFCAYLAYHFWRHGESGSEIFGSRQGGYIVNPKLGSGQLRVTAA